MDNSRNSSPREEGHLSWLARKIRRLTGEENYRFGDFTRELVRRYRESVSGEGTTEPSAGGERRSSSHHSHYSHHQHHHGRSAEREARAYHYGVETGGSPWGRDRGFSTDDSSSYSVSPPALSYSLSSTPSATKPPVTIDDFWTGFFRSAYEAGTAAVKRGEILYDDLDCQEPFLYLGVPGLAILGIVLDSIRMTGKKQLDTDAMVLGDGLKMKTSGFPPCDPEVRPWFESIVKAKYELAKIVLIPAEVDYLKHIVLCASTREEDPDIGSDIESEKKDKIHRMAGLIQGLSTNLTQLSWYKQHFEDVLDTLMIDCSHHQLESSESARAEEEAALEQAITDSLRIS